MGWNIFGGKRKNVLDKYSSIEAMSKPPEPKAETYQQRKDREYEECKARAPDYVAEVRIKDVDNWKLALGEFEADKASYGISAVRHGDFLMLMIERDCKEWNEGSPAPTLVTKHATAINLSLVKRIEIVSGRAPCRDGKARLWFNLYHGDNKIEIDPYGILSPPTRLFLGDEYDTDYDRYYAGHYDDYKRQLDVTIENLTLWAKSDTLLFVGTDTKLSIPFGMGREVETIILKAIADGYVPPKIIGDV